MILNHVTQNHLHNYYMRDVCLKNRLRASLTNGSEVNLINRKGVLLLSCLVYVVLVVCYTLCLSATSMPDVKKIKQRIIYVKWLLKLKKLVKLLSDKKDVLEKYITKALDSLSSAYYNARGPVGDYKNSVIRQNVKTR